MISHLSSPSVCVIDDEEPDYRPILDALMRLGIGCVHVRGDNMENLPPRPFSGLRLVFMDLHLSGQSGKNAASHAANVFLKVVAKDTVPVVTVIWSKYADDRLGLGGEPPEDELTEADLFKQALLDEAPEFKERVVFLEMPKAKGPDRPDPETWSRELQEKIQGELNGHDAFEILWAWESLLHDTGIGYSVADL